MTSEPAGPEASRERPHRRRGASALPYLIGLGLVFLLLAFSESARQACEDWFGLQRVVLAAVAFVCLHAAWLSFDTARSRERLLDLLADTMKFLRGPDLARDADAIDVLVKAMASANVDVRNSARAHLVRLTGRDLGDDAGRWIAWWAEQREISGSSRPTGPIDSTESPPKGGGT